MTLLRTRRWPVPADLVDRPHRRATAVMRRWEWAFPTARTDLEILSALPQDWDRAPRASRRPPLLFVHGIGSGAWAFAEHWFGASVRRGYPAYAVSLRGHGGSTGGPGLTTAGLRDYVNDVLQAVVRLPEPPVLIGHSLGAAVVQAVIERYPARAAVLVAPTPAYGVGENLWAQLRRSPLDVVRSTVTGRSPHRPELFFSALDSERGESFLRRMGRESPRAMAELLLPRQYGPVYGPVAVAGCEHDALIRPIDVKHTASVYGVRPIWLPGAGHLVMLDGCHSVALDVVLDWVDDMVHPPVSPPVEARL